MLQVVVSSYEAASSIIIEFDMDNSIFGLPREFVVASAGKSEMIFCNRCRLCALCSHKIKPLEYVSLYFSYCNVLKSIQVVV